MKKGWFLNVARLVESEAMKPSFPGDGSTVIPTLERLADKLLGECHNGNDFGSDECPACRAYRTEEAERIVDGLEFERDRLRVQNEALFASEKGLQDRVKTIVEQNENLQREYGKEQALKSEALRNIDIASKRAKRLAADTAKSLSDARDTREELDKAYQGLEQSSLKSAIVDEMIERWASISQV